MKSQRGNKEGRIGSQEKRDSRFGNKRGENRERHKTNTNEIHQHWSAEKFADSKFERSQAGDALEVERVPLFFLEDAVETSDAAAGSEHECLHSQNKLEKFPAPNLRLDAIRLTLRIEITSGDGKHRADHCDGQHFSGAQLRPKVANE